MENFKLDLSKLTPVAEKDRVKGNWYVVADDKEGFKAPGITQYHSSSRGMDLNGEQSWADWKYWFAIPPNLPGFPKAQLPDEFEVNAGEWWYTNKEGEFVSLPMNSRFRRKLKVVPTLVLPAGTVDERRKRLQEELEKLDSL